MERKKDEVVHIVLERCKRVGITSASQVAMAPTIFIMAPICFFLLYSLFLLVRHTLKATGK
jgi:hypothetical protein